MLPTVLILIWQVLCVMSLDTLTTNSKCERITIPMCKDSLYNETRLPNLLGHHSQSEAQQSIAHFKPLVHAKCSKHLKFFLCSIFTPMCSHRVDEPITSCKSVCEEVKGSCQKLLQEYDLEWPEMLNCSKFPTDGLCMQPFATAHNQNTPVHTSDTDNERPENRPNMDVCARDFFPVESLSSGVTCRAICGRDILFDEENKHFAELWMAIWASVCLVVTAFTVLTCCLDGERFHYPERSIIHLAACFHIYSWTYIARLIMGHQEVGCQPLKEGGRHLIGGGLDNPKCVIVFIVLYYCSIASGIWFCVLTFTWFLSASKKWSHEAIDACSSYFHLVAWGIPAVLTIAVLITHKVDSSELTGLCYVGNWDTVSLGTFVVAPLCLILVLGLLFDVLGFLGGCQVRTQLRNRGDCRDIGKLEKLMVKIGIFSFLYVIPAVCILGAHVYHMSVLVEWDQALKGCTSSDPRCVVPAHKPQVGVYMLSVFMQLMVGVTTGMWVGSRKTCHTWLSRLCCGLLPLAQVKSKLAVPPQPQSSSIPLVPLPVRTAVHRPPGSLRTESSSQRTKSHLYAPVGSCDQASKV